MITPVGISSFGEMGHRVAKALIDHDMPVIGCLEGRSERSQKRARAAGIESVENLNDVVQQADLFLSILPPVHALEMARKIAATGENVTYVDCNAVSPHTAIEIGDTLGNCGIDFIDAGIIGPPPTKQGVTRFYASGEHVDKFVLLSQYGLDIRILGNEIGQASGFKMCYASQTKGRYAIFIESLVAAYRLGCYHQLIDELKLSQHTVYTDIKNTVPGIPAKSNRWIVEMEKIAESFGAVGMTREIFYGVADMYRAITGVHLSEPNNLNLEELIAHLAKEMK